MMEPIQICSLHPVSWRENRYLGYRLVLPKCGRFWAADLDLMFIVYRGFALKGIAQYQLQIIVGGGHSPKYGMQSSILRFWKCLLDSAGGRAAL